MELTAYQQEMLEGKYGKGKAMAMEILKTVGESFEAKRMVPISRAHVSLSAQDADVWFAEKMLTAGASCAVPPTVNPGYCLDFFRSRNMLDQKAIDHMEHTDRVYRALGAVMTYSCTPYLFGNIPHYGEILSYSETSVSVYVNSVLGARTNRESLASSLCAAITGFTPEYGMLLPENRYADILVDVEAEMSSVFDYALLGLMGKKIGKGIPVFRGLPKEICTEALIQLGAELNVSGAYEMFHILGVTPDAPDLTAATGGKEPKRHVVITRADLEEELARFSPVLGEDIDFVILGCPHYDYEQVKLVDDLLGEVPSKVPVWIHTSAEVAHLAGRTGVAQRLKEKNVELVPETCVDQACCWRPLAGKAGVSDSPKASYYMRTFGVRLAVREREQCLRWAQKGKVE